MSKIYIDKDELVFEIIVCKGKGKVSDRLSNMFYIISKSIIKKNVFNLVELHDDQIMEAYTMMMESWNLVDTDKYTSNLVFAYFSERAKRSYTKIYNIYLDRQIYQNRYSTPIKYSLSNIYSL